MKGYLPYLTLPYLTFYKPDQLDEVLTMTWILAGVFASREENQDLKGALQQAIVIRDRARQLSQKLSAAKEFDSWELPNLESDIAKFENLLEYDLNEQHVYAIDKIGLYNTDLLIEKADDHLPAAVRMRLMTEPDLIFVGRAVA